MESTDPAGSPADARQRLLEIWADPQVRGYARRYARDPDLADDALQSTYMTMARLKHLDQIENLRGYFYRVLRREVARELGHLGALVAEDFMRLAEEQEGDGVTSGRAPPTGFEEAVCSLLTFRTLLNQLTSAHRDLMATVAARSGDPDRYRAVVYAAAEAILRAGLSGDSSDADSNEAFRAAYPEYFDQPGAAANTRHQRLLRARADIRSLLQAVIS